MPSITEVPDLRPILVIIRTPNPITILLTNITIRTYSRFHLQPVIQVTETHTPVANCFREGKA
jgi:hypothetical protein